MRKEREKGVLEFGLDHRVDFDGVVGEADDARGKEIDGTRIRRVLPSKRRLRHRLQQLFLGTVSVRLINIAFEVERGGGGVVAQLLEGLGATVKRSQPMSSLI